jgi:uncharacterized protein YbjT (DUF2867 family)
MTARVLVTASTGTVGRHVVAALADTDVEITAGSRDPAALADRFASFPTALPDRAVGAVADPVAFDFDRPETWGPALAGVDAVFLVRPPGVDAGAVRSFVDAAARVGVEQVAYLSTLGADRNVLIPHHRIERHVAASGVDYTFLRASFFAQNLHEVHGADVRERDELFVPAGDGATSFVDARDVGAVAATVLAEPGHRDVAYDLTGSAALTYREVAAVFSEVLGRRVTYANPSILGYVARMRSRGHPLGYVLLTVGIYTTARLGLADRVTDDVERLLGRPPRRIDDYVTDYAAEFRLAGSRGVDRAG